MLSVAKLVEKKFNFERKPVQKVPEIKAKKLYMAVRVRNRKYRAHSHGRLGFVYRRSALNQKHKVKNRKERKITASERIESHEETVSNFSSDDGSNENNDNSIVDCESNSQSFSG